MQKILKISLTCLAFIFLALFTAPFFIDVNNYKPEISQAVHDATGRELNIEHISLSVFPWIGLTLQNVQLQNRQGFKQQHLLTIKEVDIQLKFMPLLSQHIEVERFTLDTPIVWLEQRADGSNNWADLQQTSPSTTKEPNAAIASTTQNKIKEMPSSLSLNANLLHLHGGQVFWSQEGTGTIELSDIQLKIFHLQLTQPIAIDFSAKLGGDSLNMHANIGPINDINDLDISKLPAHIKLHSDTLSLATLAPWLPTLSKEQTQQFGELKDSNISMNISVEQHADGMIISSGNVQVAMKNTLSSAWEINTKETFNIQKLNLDINGMHALTLSGTVKHLQQKPSFEIRVETASLQRLWLNTLIPSLEDAYRNHAQPWQLIKVGALIAGDQDIVAIRNLQLLLDDEPVQISGHIALGKTPDIQLRISANELHLDPWIPPSKVQDSDKGKHPTQDQDAKTTAEIEPDLTFLKPWYISIQLSAKAIHVMKLKLDNLRLTLSAEKGIVRLNPLRFGIGDGQVTENFTLYANQYPVTWKESMRAQGIAIHPILNTLADFDKLSGTAELTTDLSGKGLLPNSITSNLNGRGHFVFENGQLKGINIAKTLRTLKQQQGGATSGTDFTQMQGNFRIKKGVISNTDLYMASPLFRLTGKGKVYLNPAKVDYQVRPRLISSLQGQGGNRHQQGVVIPLHITGPFDHLDIALTMDREALLQNATALKGIKGLNTSKDQIKKAKDAAKTSAEEKLRNALKGLGF